MHQPSSLIPHPFLVIQSYPVFVGPGPIDSAGKLVKARGKVFVITSSALMQFGKRVAASLQTADILQIEEGEANKTLDTANTIVTQLLDRGGKRDSLAVVAGGGMIGDTARFAA